MAKNKKKVVGGGSGDVSSQQLLDEILLRQEGDSYLQKQFDDLKDTTGAGGDVELERQQRIQADQVLQTAINNLSTSVVQAVSDLDDLIIEVESVDQAVTLLSQTVVVAGQQITQLSLDLEEEEQARITKDNQLQNQIDAIQQNSPDISSLTQLVTDERTARIGADQSLQNQINSQGAIVAGINSTVNSHTTQIQNVTTQSQQNTNQLAVVAVQASAAIQQSSDNTEAIVELQEAFENLPFDIDPELDCTTDVQPDMLVYIDSTDGRAKPAIATSPNTMPAQFYVKSKTAADKCTVTKEILKSIPGDTFAGKTLFVSESVPGSVQTTVPTGTGKVLQPVGVGLSGSKRHYSISDRFTVRS